MKINPTAMNHFYKAGTKNSAEPAASLSQAEKCAASKVDTISISSAGSSQSEVGKITKSVMREVARLDDPARIDSIRKAVEDGTYQISASAVADSILQHIFFE